MIESHFLMSVKVLWFGNDAFNMSSSTLHFNPVSTTPHTNQTNRVMKLEEKSPVSRRSSSMFNMHSESRALQELQRVRATNRRFSFIAAAAIFLLILTLISLVVFDLCQTSFISSNQNKTSQSRHFEHLGDLISAQQWKVVEDVEISPITNDENETKINENKETNFLAEEGNISESVYIETPAKNLENNDNSMDSSSGHLWDMSQIYGKQNSWDVVGSLNDKWYLGHTADNSANRWGLDEKEENRLSKRWDYGEIDSSIHANHRYDNNITPIQKHFAWKPRPFTFANENSSINSEHEKERRPTVFSPPVRFRGVYLEPKSSDEPPTNEFNEERNENYYNKINTFFSRQPINHQDSSEIVEDSPEQIADGNSDSYTEAIFSEQELSITPKSWNRKKSNPARKPFTVMLDIYPMGKEDAQDNIKHQHLPIKRPKGTIYIPLRPGQEYLEPEPPGVRYIPQVMLPPKQRRKGGRMLMKLNLFPKGVKKNEQRRRTWGMFSQQEDDYYDDVEDDIDDGIIDEEENSLDTTSSCHGVIGHNPFGKPITAKWKDQNGDLIHAKYVALKQYKNRMDHFIDPR